MRITGLILLCALLASCSRHEPIQILNMPELPASDSPEFSASVFLSEIKLDSVSKKLSKEEARSLYQLILQIHSYSRAIDSEKVHMIDREIDLMKILEFNDDDFRMYLESESEENKIPLSKLENICWDKMS